MKKFISLILIMLMAFATVSCSVSGNNDSSDPSNNLEDSQNEDVPQLGGDPVIFKIQKSLVSSVFFPDELESARGDLMRKRYDDVALKYEADLRIETYDGVTAVKDFTAAFMADQRYSDFYEAHPDVLYKMNQLGGIIAINSVWDDDKIYDGKWGSKMVLDTITYDGELLGVKSGYWGVPIPNYDGVLYINNKMLYEISQPHPHELDEQDNWNWQSFEDIAAAVTRKTAENDYFAVNISDSFNMAAIYSNGGRFINKDESGKFKVSFMDEKVINAIEWVSSLVEKDYMRIGDSKTFSVYKTMAFIVSPVWFGYRTGTEDTWPIKAFEAEGYSWAQFPKGPSGSSHDAKAGGAVLNDRFVTITSERVYSPSIIAMMIDDIFEPLDGETTTSWKESFRRDHFFDTSKYISSSIDRSFDKYEMMLENVNYNDFLYIESEQSSIKAALASAVRGTKTATEALSALVENVQAKLDDFTK